MTVFILLPFLSICMCRCTAAHEVENVITQTPSGPVKGVKGTFADTGDTLYEFRGIPFAKPPIGPLRFQKPEAIEKWTEALDATTFGSACPQNIPQTDFMSEYKTLKTSEDCLFINIYVPKVLKKGKQLSVMVWIHRGGFQVGYGHEDDLSRMAIEGDVIMVSFNYRLGLLGFLALDHPAARCNYGLWDQKMALQWVHDNIEAFGGNPSSVTIFGESAGGYSSSIQSLISSNTGLFQRVISQSGVHSKILMRTRTAVNQYAKELSVKSNCPINDKYLFVDCLRNKTIADLLEIAEFYTSISQELLQTRVLFKSHSYPVVDGELFHANPIEELEDSKSKTSTFFRSLDFIAGTTSNEGSLLYLILLLPELQEYYSFNVSEGIPHHVVCEALLKPYVDTYLKANDKIKSKMCEFYQVDGSMLEQSKTSTNALADILFTYPTVKMLEYHLNGKGKTFQYIFSKKSPDPFGGPPPKWFQGCGHGDELVYLFKNGVVNLTDDENI